MSNAIIPAKVAQILPLEVFTIERGGRNTVVLPSGKIASDIELIAYDEDARIAKYELRVANESSKVLACYAYAVRGASGERPLTCTSIAVLPFSGVAVTFELPLPFIGNYERITVEMHGDGIDLSSDTVPPDRDYRVLVRRSAGVAAVTLGTVFAALAGLFQPHITALSAPGAVLGGTSVKIAYEAHGLGRIQYGLIAPDGTTVGGGATNVRSGSVSFNMPPVATSRAYIVSLEQHNFFGGDARTAVIKDLATPPPRMLTRIVQPAAIRSLGVDRSHVSSGEKIVVRYSYVAQNGVLRLFDDKDTVWAATSIDAGGLASFVAPHVEHPQRMRVALHVEKDNTSADSEVGLTLLPSVPPPLKFRAINNAPVQIIAQTIFAGDVIPLRITKAVADLHIALQDPHGAEVEGYNVDGDQAVLHAPPTAGGSVYTIVITYTDRNGQETIVTPVSIAKKSDHG